MGRRPKTEFEFDGAISFAGENREIAKSLAEKLKAKGLSIFYDHDHLADLWGKDRKEFERIYGPASRYVIPIISEHYVRKDWTQFEFGSAKREQRNRSGEFILAIRVDESRMLGLHDDEFYVSLDNQTLDEIADLFEAKIRADGGGRKEGSRHRSTKPKRRVAILSDEAKHVLGIVVVARLPLPRSLYTKLFPNGDWAGHLRVLKGHGLVRETGGLLRASPEAVKSIGSDVTESKACAEKWVRRLEGLKDHPDIALYLAPHYMSEARWDDAACLLSDIASGGLHGHWNETFLRLLGDFAGSRIARLLNGNSRIRLYHALGLCSTEGEQFESALGWFEKARKESMKARDTYWIGQCLINSGIAFDRSGNRKQAATAYQGAVKHGEANNHPLLAGRALGNLAQLRMSEDDPDAAIALIWRSIEWKKEAKDHCGTAISSAQIGMIEAQRGNLRAAIGHFRRAESLCADQGMIYDQAKSAYNIGKAYSQLGEHGKALTAFRRAGRLAADDDFIDLRLLAAQGFALACQALKRFSEIESTFKELSNSPAGAKHQGCIFSAKLGMGIAQAAQGHVQEGRRNLHRALRIARKSGKLEWMCQVQVCLAGLSDGDVFRPSSKRLARIATGEQKRRNLLVAAELWELATEGFIRTGQAGEAERAYSSAETCLTQAGSRERDLVALRFKLFAWRWRSGRFVEAIEILDQAERIAAISGLEGDRVKALDEKGVCLQRLRRSKEALPIHRRAVRLAEKHGLPTQLRISLNNLGQACRRLGRTEDAVAAFESSEAYARSIGAHPEALGTMVNRGIVLQEGGDYKVAGSVLRRCSTESRRRECWREHVMAEEALGNLAWHQKHLARAAERYKGALATAKKRRITESEVEIAVNYASLLEQTGKAKQALKLLRGYEDLFGGMIEAHVCHNVLANLLFDKGEVEAAKRQWQKGKAHAQSLGNRDFVAICSSSLAEVYEGEGRLDLAREELEEAIEHEAEHKGRAILLGDLLRVVLRSGDEEKTEVVFDEARGLAAKHKLTELFVDIHMQVGDHYWRGDLESKQNALKAYFLASLEALSRLDLQLVPDVFGHIVRHLTNANYAPSDPEFDSLLLGLRSELPSAKKDIVHGLGLVLWPFEAARRLLPLVGDPAQFEAEVRRLSKAGFRPM